MTLIAKEIIQTQEAATRYFELFETIETKDIDGNIVKIPQLKERISLEQLKQKKIVLTEQITLVNNNIKLIEDIINKGE